MIPNYILIDDDIYLGCNSSIKISMADLIALGLKEHLKILGLDATDETIQHEANYIAEHKKLNYEQFHEQQNIVAHLKYNLMHLEDQIQYGNPILPHIYSYLQIIVEQKNPNYQASLNQITQQFPPILELNYQVGKHTLKRVRQKHKTSCGIACVAMITHIPYETVLEDAKKLFKWKRRHFKTTGTQLVALLAHYGISNIEYIIDCSWPSCTNLAIAVINNINGCGHWVIFVRDNGKNYILDPDHEQPLRIDFWNMALDSFINFVDFHK